MRGFITRPLGQVLVAAAIALGAGGVYVVNTSDSGGSQPANTMYVRAAAAGNGSGTDWTNACTDFTGSCATLTRGNTYYVAGGTYAARTFNTAVSGTTVITVKGATVADHGGSSGWSSSYAVGTGNQAHWSQGTVGGSSEYNWMVSGARYFVFDGNTACGTSSGSWCSDQGSYGFTFDSTGCSGDQYGAYYQTGTVSNVTFKHISMDMCGEATSDVGRVMFSDDFAQATMSDILFSRIYCKHAEVCIDARKTLSSGVHATNITVEKLYATGATSTPSHHGEVINPVDEVDNLIVRWSYFDGCAGTACIAGNASGPAEHDASCTNSGEIYGNVFAGSAASGVIMGTTGSGVCGFSNTKIYNNTFYNNSGATVGQNTGTTGNVFQNNIVYGSDASLSNVTNDFNWYRSSTNTPTEANGQTGGSGSPFVNAATGNFRLTADTNAFSTSGQPAGNGTDPDGVTRSSSRGAYQFTG